jgi:hypothetical protein
MTTTDTIQRGDAQACNESNSLADFHERLQAERLKAENVDDATLAAIEWMVLMRLNGASIRSMASFFGYSKSAMGRLILQIEQPSQMGQDTSESAANTGLPRSDLSQMGQAAE